ncbi:MAG TPA: SDR family oxidoreductase [Cyclobacteriaceae bacterium]|nr:SDR family oxidoreductase [Cyclobacteriaceae bacterium]
MEKLKSVLITGGFGNLGSWLVDFLSGKGFKVYVLSRSEKSFLSREKYIPIICDLEDEVGIKRGLSGISLNYVIHAGSMNDPFIPSYHKKSLLVNSLGTRNLLQGISDHKIAHLIYLSTYHVYGKNEGIVTEADGMNPQNDYAITHSFGEEYVRMFHRQIQLPYTILRLSNSYGCPMDVNTSKWYLVLNDFSRMACTGKKIILKTNGKPKRDFIWMGTVCRIIQSLLKLPESPNDVFNLSGGQTYNIFEIAVKVSRAWKEYSGVEVPIILNEDDHSPESELTISPDKLKKIIQFRDEDKFSEEAKKIFDLLAK